MTPQEMGRKSVKVRIKKLGGKKAFSKHMKMVSDRGIEARRLARERKKLSTSTLDSKSSV